MSCFPYCSAILVKQEYKYIFSIKPETFGTELWLTEKLVMGFTFLYHVPSGGMQRVQLWKNLCFGFCLVNNYVQVFNRLQGIFLLWAFNA